MQTRTSSVEPRVWAPQNSPSCKLCWKCLVVISWKIFAASRFSIQLARLKITYTAQLRHQQREVFSAIFLDNQHRLLCYEALFYGSINSAQVHPREVVKRALFHNAAALILAQNHPSGVAEPSDSDRHITELLERALSVVDVRVLDHVVVGEGPAVSFAERGYLSAS
jgi:DNA repair protein RadC